MIQLKKPLPYWGFMAVVSILITGWFTDSVFAEFYRYIDPDGKVKYTDDFSKLPIDQQSAIRQYTGYQETGSQGDVPKEDGKTNADEKEAQPKAEVKSSLPEDRNAPQTDLMEAKKKIDESKKQLDEEYKSISAEKARLDQEKARLEQEKFKVGSPQEIKEFNENVLKLNERIEAYETKRKAFDAEVEAYNAEVSKQTRERQSKAPGKVP